MRQGKLLLTTDELNLVLNKKYNDTNYFLPLQDTYNNWVIEMAQVDNITNPDFLWVKNCPEIEFEYKKEPLPQL